MENFVVYVENHVANESNCFESILFRAEYWYLQVTRFRALDYEPEPRDKSEYGNVEEVAICEIEFAFC